jgi:hypothetical protein
MATTAPSTDMPKLYWVAAVVALLWALAGCFAYVTQVGMSAEELARLPQAQQDIWNATPAWITGAYAVAVWSGFAGAIALLLRRRWARPLYLVSLVAVAVQFGWTFAATNILATMGPSAAGFPAFIFAAGVLQWWFARVAAKAGWLT